MRLSKVAAGVVLCKSATGARLGSNHVIFWKRWTLCSDTKVPMISGLLISPTFQCKCKGAIERISVCFVLTVHIIRQSVKLHLGVFFVQIDMVNVCINPFTWLHTNADLTQQVIFLLFCVCSVYLQKYLHINLQAANFFLPLFVFLGVRRPSVHLRCGVITLAGMCSTSPACLWGIYRDGWSDEGPIWPQTSQQAASAGANWMANARCSNNSSLKDVL